MTHDHRCPSLRYVVLGGRVCVCDIVAEIRNDTLDAVVERVESLPWSHENWIAWDERAAILAAIKAGQPVPARP
jgi:hypothetical protein